MRRHAENITSSPISSQETNSSSLDFYQFLDFVSDPCMLIDQEGTVVYANARACDMFGYPSSEIVGIAVEGLIINKDGFIAEDWTALYSHSNPWQLLGVQKKGDSFPIEISMSALPLASGEHIWLTLRSVDRKKYEDELRIYSAYTRSLIEASLDPMVVISPEGKITDVNEASVKVTGVVREDLIGTDFSDYFTEPKKAREGYQQVFAKGYVADYPLTIRHNLREVLYNASVYRDEKNQVLGVFATARDITAQRKQEMEIKTLNEELEQRIIELESFSYSVSHDLRAPLRAIDGFIAIFLAKYLDKVDEEGQRLLDNVRRNAEKMNALIDELLTLSRIGMKDIQISPINMKLQVQASIEDLNEMRGKAQVRVKELKGAMGDVALIRQVLVNLISNAFKYSSKKTAPEIEIGSYSQDGENHYYVKDNGVGFDMEYANKLFGVFQRLHDSTEYHGTGVGLAIVKRIITRHGGRVWAKGKEGEGATFFFSLKPK